MASENISLLTLKSKLSREKIPNNLLIFSHEKIVYDFIIDFSAEKFIGKEFNRKTHLNKYYSDDVHVDTLIEECSNLGFFADKKVIAYFLVKRAGTKGGLKKNELEYLTKYLSNPNPDTLLILLVTDPDFKMTTYGSFLVPGLKVYAISPPSSADLTKFISEYLEDYSISDEAVKLLLSHLNPSYENVHAEMEKLKVYCLQSKNISEKDVNLCIGISKEFNEYDFIEAIFSRNAKQALKIYDNIVLRDDVEILLLHMISSAFISIYKLCDRPAEVSKLNAYRDLKIFKNTDRILSIYKNYKSGINELKIKKAFDYIYRTDVDLKSTQKDKKTLFTKLITELVDL